MAVFLIVVYVGLRLIVNTVMSRNNSPVVADTYASKVEPVQYKTVRVQKSKPKARKKTIGNVEVTRIDKASLQAAGQKPGKPGKSEAPLTAGAGAGVARPLSAGAMARASQEPDSEILGTMVIPDELIMQPISDEPAPAAAIEETTDLAQPARAEETVIESTQPIIVEKAAIEPVPSADVEETTEPALAITVEEAVAEFPQSVTIEETAAEPAQTIVVEEAVEQTQPIIVEKAAIEPVPSADVEEAAEPAQIIVEEAAAETEQPVVIVEEAVEPAQAVAVEETAELAQPVIIEETAAEPAQAAAVEETTEPAQAAAVEEVAVKPEQPAIDGVAEETAQPDRFDALIAKAEELVEEGKYNYAVRMAEACQAQASPSQRKRADIILLECLVLSNQFEQARKKWLEVLNKMYILEPVDKLKLKEILGKLNNNQRQVS